MSGDGENIENPLGDVLDDFTGFVMSEHKLLN